MDKIVVDNITKIFGDRPERALALLDEGVGKAEILERTGCGVGVNQASFTVREGEILVVMGLSGSGKSTLVRCLNRLIEPTSGTVTIDGEDITALSPDELRAMRLAKLGMVFQNFALYPHRTVAENAAYGLEIKGVDAATRRAKALEALELVGLKGQEDQYPRQLSGGMQQRVGLARALALDADILLMDEAFSALDPLIRRQMQDELLNLQAQMKKTIVFISHDLDEALKLGCRIVLMKDGAIVQIGTPEDILTNPANDYVASFVEDVDITKVLAAESVMVDTEATVYLSSHGPRSAMRLMRKSGWDQVFVLNSDKEVIGLVPAEAAADAAERGETELHRIMVTEFFHAAQDTPATEIIPMLAAAAYPIPVLNEKKRLQGVVVRGSLLSAMAERGRPHGTA